MSTPKTTYICTSCGAHHAKWSGRCSGCEAWNTLEEGRAAPARKASAPKGGSLFSAPGSLVPTNLQTRGAPPTRTSTTIGELDRVLGGGLVEGSAVLLAGDPGAGKSTLLMQALAGMAQDRDVLYASGEESADQIRLRAERLGVADRPVQLVTSTDAAGIAHLMSQMPKGSVVAIDSLHAMDAGVDSSPGSVAQVKAAAALFIDVAKTRGISTILINHVTKEGGFAGPQLLRHAVDVSLLFQNETSQGYLRVLRSDKNRFGADDDVGIFEMSSEGLVPIANPSELFMAQRAAGAFGTTIFASIEGTRPLLLEVQALVTPTTFGTGRRQVTGWDGPRLHMLLAMMTARLGITMADKDVYVNIAGGIKVSDPGMDLAVVLALLSAHMARPVRESMVVFGEIGLAGEVRGVLRPEARMREALAQGFTDIVAPAFRGGKAPPTNGGTIHTLDRAARLLERADTFLLP